MQFINYNGTLMSEADAALPFFNRGLLYGDGFFETLVMMQGKIPLIYLHMQRIAFTVSLLRGELPVDFTAEKLSASIHDLATANGLTNARIRVHFIRSGAGLYLPNQRTFDYVIQTNPLDRNTFQVSSISGIGVIPDFVKPVSALSQIKSSSAQWYVLGAQLAQEKGWEEMLLLNSNGFVAEALSSNVFIVKGDKILTPPIADGGVDGVMRKFLLQNFPEVMEERSLALEDILQADELWLTNAVRGLQSVTNFEGKVYGNKKAVELTASLNQICFG
jgi:branched-chain amino acid aminotransferase